MLKPEKIDFVTKCLCTSYREHVHDLVDFLDKKAKEKSDEPLELNIGLHLPHYLASFDCSKETKKAGLILRKRYEKNHNLKLNFWRGLVGVCYSGPKVNDIGDSIDWIDGHDIEFLGFHVEEKFLEQRIRPATDRDRTPTMDRLNELNKSIDYFVNEIHSKFPDLTLTKQTMASVMNYFLKRYADIDSSWMYSTEVATAKRELSTASKMWSECRCDPGEKHAKMKEVLAKKLSLPKEQEELLLGKAIGRVYEQFKSLRITEFLPTDIVYDIGYRLLKVQIYKELDLPEEEKALLLDGVMGWLCVTPGTMHEQVQSKCLEGYVEKYGMDQLKKNIPLIEKKFHRLMYASEHARIRVYHAGEPLTYRNMFSPHPDKIKFRMTEIGSNYAKVVVGEAK